MAPSSFGMDENDDIETLKEANDCQDHNGDDDSSPLPANNSTLHRDPRLKYQPYLDSLIQSLAKRESVLGRYNYITAQSYAAIGNAYSQMQEPRSVVMYRTSYRIHVFLYGAKTNGHIIHGPLRDLLEQRGLSFHDMEGIRADIVQSTRHEMEGDMLRRFGNTQKALMEYQKAAKIEEFSFGRDNPDLAYLWRKMACLVAIPKGTPVDFDVVDRIGSKWILSMKQAKDSFSSPVAHACICRGDRFFMTGSLLYSHALSEYIKITYADCVLESYHFSNKSSSTNTKQSKKKRDKRSLNSSRHRAPKHNKSPAQNPKEIAEELNMLLARETKSPNNNIHASSSPMPSTLLDKPVNKSSEGNHDDVELDKNKEKEETFQEDEPLRKFRLAETKTSTSTSPGSNIGSQLKKHRNSSPFRSSVTSSNSDTKRVTKSKLQEMIQRIDDASELFLQKEEEPPAKNKPMELHPYWASDSSYVSAATFESCKPSAKSESSMELPKQEQQQDFVSSRDVIRRRPPRQSKSESSMTVQRSQQKLPSADESSSSTAKKPKSDSYLARIASKTSKLASKSKKLASQTTKLAKKQIQRTSSFDKKQKKKSAVSSVLDSMRKQSRTSAIVMDPEKDYDDDDDNEDDADGGKNNKKNALARTAAAAAADVNSPPREEPKKSYHMLDSPPPTPFETSNFSNYFPTTTTTSNSHKTTPTAGYGDPPSPNSFAIGNHMMDFTAFPSSGLFLAREPSSTTVASRKQPSSSADESIADSGLLPPSLEESPTKSRSREGHENEQETTIQNDDFVTFDAFRTVSMLVDNQNNNIEESSSLMDSREGKLSIVFE